MRNNIPAVKRFEPGDRVYVQAQQIWLILMAFVMMRAKSNPRSSQTITYGELAELMGHPNRQAGHILGRQLGIVGKFCILNDVPPLNAIVVNQVTGVPGDEVVLRTGRNVAQEQKEVLKYDWFTLRIPTTGTFRKVWESE